MGGTETYAASETRQFPKPYHSRGREGVWFGYHDHKDKAGPDPSAN